MILSVSLPIMTHEFHIITLTIHSTSFFRMLWKKKVNCHCYVNFPFILSFVIIYYVTQIWFNFIKLIFHWKCFIFVSITFILNIVATKSITNFYWLIMIFFWFKKIISQILKNCFVFFYLFIRRCYWVIKNFFDFFYFWFKKILFGWLVKTFLDFLSF